MRLCSEWNTSLGNLESSRFLQQYVYIQNPYKVSFCDYKVTLVALNLSKTSYASHVYVTINPCVCNHMTFK